MSAKSSGGVFGTIVLVALVAWSFIVRWRRQYEQERQRSHFLSSLSHPRRLPSKGELATLKEHFAAIREAAARGDYAGVFAVYTNVPDGVSAEYRKSVKVHADLIQRFNAFVAEFDARAATEGLDLDLMLSPQFVCGTDGFEAPLRRVDVAVGFMNELEERMKGFMKEKDSLSSGKIDGANPFDLTPQWKRITDAMALMFAGGRLKAVQIKKLVLLHRDHPQDWKLDDGEVLYYGADLCGQVHSVRAEILKELERDLTLEKVLSETQRESFNKLGKAFDKAVSR